MRIRLIKKNNEALASFPIKKGNRGLTRWDSRVQHAWLHGLTDDEDQTFIAGPFCLLKDDDWLRDENGEVIPFHIDAAWTMENGEPEIVSWHLTKCDDDWGYGHTNEPYELPEAAAEYSSMIEEALPLLLADAYKKATGKTITWKFITPELGRTRNRNRGI